MILDHLANRLGVNWPMPTSGESPTKSRRPSRSTGLTWSALGDQGIQWDASAVPQQPDYRPVAQPARPGERRLALVTGTALYDGGGMFYRTEQMRNMAYNGVALLHPDDAAALAVSDGATLTVMTAAS